MNFKYKEIGKFDAHKAAKALLELAQEIKLEDEKERKMKIKMIMRKQVKPVHIQCVRVFLLIYNYIKE